MEKRKREANKVDITTTLEEAKDELKKAKSKQKEVVIKGIELCKKELLD